MTTKWTRMSAEQFRIYAAHTGAGYAADIQLTYNHPQDRTLAQRSRSMTELLPQGIETPKHYLFTLHDAENNQIGVLWFGTYMEFGATTLFIYDLEILPNAQRRGHATEVLRMIERWAAINDVSRLELNVVANNHAAQAFYRANGLMQCEITMAKQLG